MRFIDFSKSKKNEIIVLTIIFVCTIILCYGVLCYYEHMKFNKRVDTSIGTLELLVKSTSPDGILRITSKKTISILQNCKRKQSLAKPILANVYILVITDTDGLEEYSVHVEWLEDRLGNYDIRFTNTDSGDVGVYNFHSITDDASNKYTESLDVRYLLDYTFGINGGTFIMYYESEEGLKLSKAAKQGVLKAELVQDNIVCSNTVNVVHHEIKRK
ncbi:MAG: hypothetical protein LBU65_14505 [Planctomycetaceae bacterium]|jgi:hypothetical protein|nr:hypothetical protein [Planctomycetaceae bacterium]